MEWSRLKAFLHGKISTAENLSFVLGKVENIMEKGLPGFSSFPIMFSKVFFDGVIKICHCLVTLVCKIHTY